MRKLFWPVVLLTAFMACSTSSFKIPIIDAARNGENEKISRLLVEGTDINTKWGNETALTAAADSNRLDLAKYLLERGADPNIGNPLEIAIRNRNYEMVELLFHFKVNPNILRDQKIRMQAGGFNRVYCTDLFTALYVEDSRIIEFLLKNGADPNVDARLNSLLVNSYLEYVLHNKSLNTLETMLKYQSNIDKSDPSRLLAIVFSRKSKDGTVFHPDWMERLKLLLDFGLDPDCRIGSGEYAIYEPYGYKQTEIERNNRVTLYDKSCNTPLIHALNNNYIEAIRLLLNYGANPFIGFYEVTGSCNAEDLFFLDPQNEDIVMLPGYHDKTRSSIIDRIMENGGIDASFEPLNACIIAKSKFDEYPELRDLFPKDERKYFKGTFRLTVDPIIYRVPPSVTSYVWSFNNPWTSRMPEIMEGDAKFRFKISSCDDAVLSDLFRYNDLDSMMLQSMPCR
ncbi:MAG: ankyrin repeat domain-containing protein [Candidatus Krumholzibacteriota bacterium]|nr:ankyrin repeat domain-containing protein [Candidatus Krumholzibacteriota bacterium]